MSISNAFSTLSSNRVDQVLTANTLTEATKINNFGELIDRIVDWVKGGTQYQAIKDLFDAIQTIKVENSISPETSRLEKFMELRALVSSEHRDKFTLKISEEKDINNDWGYALVIGGSTVYECEKVFDKTKSHSERDKLPFFHAKKIGMEVEEAFQLNKTLLEDKNLHIKGEIECMVDGKEEQQALAQKLDDCSYGKDNFIGCKESNNPATFIACFKNDKELEFSNRDPSKFEFRGLLLKDALEKDSYTNLKDLVLQRHLTENDSALKYALGSVKGICYLPLKMEELLDKQEFLVLHQELASIRVGNTTLDKLWGLET